MTRRILTGPDDRFRRDKKAPINPGDTVVVNRGDLEGSVGIVARYYPEQDVYSLRIKPSDCTDNTLRPAPDKFIHWLAHRVEITPINKTLRMT